MKKDRKNNFSTPEGYFESFNERLMQRLGEETDTKNSLIPKSDGFIVPDGYFETLNDTVSKRLPEYGTKVIQLNTNKKWYYTAAAVAAIIVTALVWNTENTSSLEFDDLVQTEITDYFENSDFELSSYDIAEMLPTENITIDDITEISWNNGQVMDYLEETIMDFDELNFDYDELEE